MWLPESLLIVFHYENGFHDGLGRSSNDLHTRFAVKEEEGGLVFILGKEIMYYHCLRVRFYIFLKKYGKEKI